MTTPYLVLGATGNVGAPLVRLLAEAGHNVRAASRHPAEAAPSEKGDQSIEPVMFDWTDPTTHAGAFAGVQTMFLLRPPTVTNASRDIFPALELARAAGVRHVVFLSVQGADRIRVLPHTRMEKWLQESGLDWTFLRASFFDQNLVAVHGKAIRSRGELLMPAGRGRTAFVDADDVAAVAARAMLDPSSHRNRAWTPTGSESLTYGEVAGIMTAVLGRPIRYAQPGLLSYLVRARRHQDLPLDMIAMTSLIYTTARVGLAARLTTDVQDVLGRPPTTMAEFVQRERAAFAAQEP